MIMSHKENRETGQSNDVLTQLLVHHLSLFQRNKTCIYSDKELGFEEQEGGGSPQQERGFRPGLMRSTSRETSRIPLQVPHLRKGSYLLQEAMKNGNTHNYFNALRRLDFRNLVRSLSR